MNTGIFFLITFIFIFIIYIIYLLIKKKFNKLMKVNQYAYLIHRYQIDENKINQNKMIILVALCNSFIIANTAIIIGLFDINVWWQMIVSFLVLFILIFIVYGIVGYFLKKK